MHALDILRREQHAVNSSQWGKCVDLVSDNYRAVCVGLVLDNYRGVCVGLVSDNYRAVCVGLVSDNYHGVCVGFVSDNYRGVCVGLVFESTIPSSIYLCIQFTFYFGLPLTSRRCEPRVLLMTLMRSGIL